MRTLIPYTPRHPKSRLGELLSGRERRAFARTMLEDVLRAVRDADGDPVVLTTERVPDLEATQHVDDRPLSEAVNAALAPPMAVVMADLALATPESLRRAFEAVGDVVVVPGRGGGTNVLVVRHDDFAVDYHGNSLGDHRAITAAAGLHLEEIDSFRLAFDVDEPDDLGEVLLHGDGSAPDWLRAHDVHLHVTDGRVGVTRSSE